MKRKLQFLLTALLLMVGVTSAWAETVTINPSKERCDRTNNATPTAWNSGYPKIATASGNTQMEVNLDARIWVLEQFEIPNIERVKSITLTYTRVSGLTNNGPLAIWNFPFTYPADDAAFSTESGSYVVNVKTALGNYPGGEVSTTNDYYIGATSGSDTRTYTLTADNISALKTAYSTTSGTLTANLLLTTSSGSTNYKFYSINSSNEAANKPKMTVEYYPVSVTIGETTTYYSEITSALKTSLTDDATIKIYDDVNMNDRIQVAANKTVDVIPQKAGITITNTNSGNLSFLCNVNGRLNVGSDEYAMTITYSSASITNSVVESSNSSAIVDIKNITFNGISTNTEYGLIRANTGKVYLKNCTFSSCASTYGTNPCIIKCGNNDGVVFEGNNKFIDCTGYDIYAASRFKVNDNGVTNTTPINVYTTTTVAATNVTKEEIPLFKLMVEGKYLKWRTEGQTGNRRDMQVAEDGSTSYDLTVSAAGAATLVLPYTTTIPTSPSTPRCYTLSYTSGDNITATEITTTLPAHTPVLVVADANTYTFTKTDAVAPSSNANLLMENYTTNYVVPATSGEEPNVNTNYILSYKDSQLGFRKVDGSTNKVQPYRAYLSVKYDAGAGAREFFSIDFGDGETTAIDKVDVENKMTGEVYNLQGVRMQGEKLPKGIYVRNGKKFVVK